MRNATLSKLLFAFAMIALFSPTYSQCTAFFSTFQARTPISGPVPWNIQVVDSSQGIGLIYLWDFGDGTTSTAQNPIHQYSGSGPYVLCLTVSSPGTTASPPCAPTTYCDTISVDTNGNLKSAGQIIVQIGDGSDGYTVSTGINESTAASIDASIFPNPAQTHAYIRFDSEEKGTSNLEIFNMKGQLIWNGQKPLKAGNNVYKIDIANFNQGLYLIKIQANDRNATGVIVKE